jgi:hypothetical protein
MLCVNFAGTLTSFKQSNMSKQHKGGNRGKKGSSGRSTAPVTSSTTQTLVGGQATNPVRSELKQQHGRFAESEKGDGGGRQAGPSRVDCSRPVRPDGNIGEKKQANSASRPVADEAPGPQMEHAASSDSTMTVFDSTMTVFGTRFLCACSECQSDNPVLAKMIHTHPNKEYFIDLLKKQRAEHEVKRVALSSGLSLQAAEFKPHKQSSDIQAVSNCSSAENQPRNSFPTVSSVHVLISMKGTEPQEPGHHGY